MIFKNFKANETGLLGSFLWWKSEEIVGSFVKKS